MEQNPAVKPLTFKEQWEQKKLLKRAKKKAKHTLQSQGFGRREASQKVNEAVANLARKPERKSAGRGR
jgi:hypothetical protein